MVDECFECPLCARLCSVLYTQALPAFSQQPYEIHQYLGWLHRSLCHLGDGALPWAQFWKLLRFPCLPRGFQTHTDPVHVPPLLDKMSYTNRSGKERWKLNLHV